MTQLKRSILFLLILFVVKSLASFILNKYKRSYVKKYSILKLSCGSSRYGYSDEDDYNKVREGDLEVEDEKDEEVDLDNEEEKEKNKTEFNIDDLPIAPTRPLIKTKEGVDALLTSLPEAPTKIPMTMKEVGQQGSEGKNAVAS